MTPWLKVKPGAYATVRETTDGKVNYREVTSPFDIPKAVRCYVDRTAQKLIIEFQYSLEDRLEPRKVEYEGCKMTLWRGVASQRLHRIDADLGSAQANNSSELSALIRKAAGIVGHEPALVVAPEVTSKIVEDNTELLSLAAA